MATVPAKTNRRWIWFFVVVFGLALLATAALVVFNLQQQLKPEQLAAARKLWDEHGPRDYTMVYTTRLNEEPEPDRFWVQVRGGRVVSSKFNGQSEPAERFSYRGMDSLFDYIEKFMKMDTEPGAPKTFVRGIFDTKTGGLLWYVRRVMGSRQWVETTTRQRVEITVESFTVP